ncbi:MAG: hypothetical protein WKG01_33565 [Kofleriaceae bacterium]
MRLWIAATLVASQVARADVPSLEVAVGDSIEREVGIAIGYRCDDPSLLGVAMRQKSNYVNVVTITGKQPGTTQCRFGIDPYRYSELHTIRIVPRRR